VRQPIPIQLAVEDSLSEATLRRLLPETGRPYAVGTCYSRGGYGYLRRTIRGFNNAARVTPFLVLTDLDTTPCPPTLIAEWLPIPLQPNLIMRVAVRSVESWLLAHRSGLASFLGISEALVPHDPDALDNPKVALINLARRSRRRDLKADILPRGGSTQGPNYNGRLIDFVQSRWRPRDAVLRSESLRSAFQALCEFRPSWA